MASASPDAVLHLAALHGLAAAGFASTSRAASLTLSTALGRYLRLVALACAERAELAGRSKVAAVDVVQALDDLGVDGVGELHEWAVGQELEGSFVGGLEELGHGLREGLRVDNGMAEYRLVHDDEIKLEEDEDGEEEGEDGDDEEGMDVDSDDEVENEVKMEQSEPIRFASPDFSWLPPLPGSTPPLSTAPLDPDSSIAPTASVPTLSIVDRYRRPIPFAQSQLSLAHPFVDPPRPSTPLIFPPATSSLPSLISTYAATASDPSIAFRQTLLRQHLTDLIRRDQPASPPDTLISPLPPPRISPIVPSYSDDTRPQHLMPLNPSRTGLLASLVHQIQSPHLPPALRERLTSLRPPQPLKRDGQPIFYNDPIRGGDDAALARARGKVPAEGDVTYLRATWDSGPRGVEKWGRGKLPTGRKVVQSGIGEEKPREAESSGAGRTLKLKIPDREGGSISPVGVKSDAATGIRLRLGGGGSKESGEGQNGKAQGDAAGFGTGAGPQQSGAVMIHDRSVSPLTRTINGSVSPNGQRNGQDHQQVKKTSASDRNGTPAHVAMLDTLDGPRFDHEAHHSKAGPKQTVLARKGIESG